MRGFTFTIRRRNFIHRTRNVNKVINVRSNASTKFVHRPLRRVRRWSLVIRVRANFQLIRGSRLQLVSRNANGRRRLRFATTRPIRIFINGANSPRPFRRNFHRFSFLFTKLLGNSRVHATPRRGRFRANMKGDRTAKLQGMKSDTPSVLQLRNISVLPMGRDLTTIP